MEASHKFLYKLDTAGVAPEGVPLGWREWSAE